MFPERLRQWPDGVRVCTHSFRPSRGLLRKRAARFAWFPAAVAQRPCSLRDGDPALAEHLIHTVTLSGARLSVFAAIEHANRRIRTLGATAHPTASWVVQAARNLVSTSRTPAVGRAI
ncbi:conserved hypothetical protein [Streptomyces viridosporus ATCC 14672]|uniref:Transposase n=1 Tax=Streptomyces viridosporus (strain ATCC 14672 / DSM 40746 / JCM 4963 / KCTC 9882 / NRRL B-12104 / FH 1290) TaxID=566461 RepID=D6A718_STRV1|nr:conserved hypothetical protein [Streptomyces viridosporus ATCC 14672]